MSLCHQPARCLNVACRRRQVPVPASPPRCRSKPETSVQLGLPRTSPPVAGVTTSRSLSSTAQCRHSELKAARATYDVAFFCKACRTSFTSREPANPKAQKQFCIYFGRDPVEQSCCFCRTDDDSGTRKTVQAANNSADTHGFQLWRYGCGSFNAGAPVDQGRATSCN